MPLEQEAVLRRTCVSRDQTSYWVPEEGRPAVRKSRVVREPDPDIWDLLSRRKSVLRYERQLPWYGLPRTKRSRPSFSSLVR